MKRILYILAIVFATSFAFSSCTEEEVTPDTELDGNGGNTSDPK